MAPSKVSVSVLVQFVLELDSAALIHHPVVLEGCLFHL